MTPIHFGNGTLRNEFSTWIGNDETGDPRKKLEIPDPDVPTEFVGSTVVDSRSSEFVTFDATSARKDVSSWLTRSCHFFGPVAGFKSFKIIIIILNPALTTSQLRNLTKIEFELLSAQTFGTHQT